MVEYLHELRKKDGKLVVTVEGKEVYFIHLLAFEFHNMMLLYWKISFI